MPELKTLFAELLEGAIDAAAQAEAKHLKADADAARALAGQVKDGAVPADILHGLLDKGYIPDMFVGAEMEVEAQLAMSTARERKTVAGGGIAFGPVRIDATFESSLQQGTNTNLSVRCLLRRVSKSTAMDRLAESVQRLSELAPGTVPTPPSPGPGR